MTQSTTNRSNQQSKGAEKTEEILKEGFPGGDIPEVTIAPSSTPRRNNRRSQQPSLPQEPQSFELGEMDEAYLASLQEEAVDLGTSAQWPLPADIKSLDAEAFPDLHTEATAVLYFLLAQRSAPQSLYYLGDLSILDTELVAVNMTRYTNPRPEVLANYSEQQHKVHEYRLKKYQGAQRIAEKCVVHLASQGKNIAVSTIREADMPIIKAALASGGKVVVVLPSNIDHSKLDLKPFKLNVERGEMLFVSQFTKKSITGSNGKTVEVDPTWSIPDASARSVTIATFAKSLLIPEVTSTAAGAGTLAQAFRALGKDVYVRNPNGREVAATELINVWGCTQLVGDSIEEALEPLI